MISLSIVLFIAVVAAAQNNASEKINQIVVKGHLEQTVIAGENIETIQILYENTGFAENYDPEYKEGSTKLTVCCAHRKCSRCSFGKNYCEIIEI